MSGKTKGGKKRTPDRATKRNKGRERARLEERQKNWSAPSGKMHGQKGFNRPGSLQSGRAR